jgi:hypothetical protein
LIAADTWRHRGRAGPRRQNTTFSGITHSIRGGFADPLRAFSEACQEELKVY